MPDVVEQATVSSTVTEAQVQDASANTSPSPAATPEVKAPEAPSTSKSDAALDPKAELLKVARDAIAPKETKPVGAPAEGSSPSTAADAAKSETDPKDPVPDDKLPFHKHPRWQEVIEENRRAKAQLQELAPQAERMNAILEFMDSHRLSGDQVAEGFEVMALMASDPMKAKAALQAQIDRIDEHLGLKLPEDIRRKVDDGFVDEETATELSKARKAQERAEAIARQTREQVETERVQRTAIAARDTVNAWDAEIRQTDPDYAIKRPLVEDLLRSHVQAHGRPATPQDALALTKSIYDKVTSHLSKVRPAPEQKKVTPSTPTAGAALPEPKTPLEVAKRAIGLF